MTNNIAIKVRNLSKIYRKKTIDGKTEEFYALKDVSFEVKKGEVVGIIGKNGSGKSTLLKILSGVTKPTSGTVEIIGSVASILDVGTGFHPDLSGRENVYMRGEFLGMKKTEIDEVYNDIVEFSEIGEFIEMPVKNYSSGMFLRLAFSILIFLKCDVLLLDEVLAVGDIGFRDKSNRKIKQILSTKEKVILIVSHSIEQLMELKLSFIITLKHGELFFENNHLKALKQFNKENVELPQLQQTHLLLLPNGKKLELTDLTFSEKEGQTLSFKIRSVDNHTTINLALAIKNQFKKYICSAYQEKLELGTTLKTVQLSFDDKNLFQGLFFVDLVFDYKNQGVEKENIFHFNIKEKKSLIKGQLKLNTTWS